MCATDFLSKKLLWSCSFAKYDARMSMLRGSLSQRLCESGAWHEKKYAPRLLGFARLGSLEVAEIF